MSEEILSLIKKQAKKGGPAKTEQKNETWLIFTIGESNTYAIRSESVKEILRYATIFPLPFVPPYVAGVLNRYGDPYVVIDFSVLEGKTAQDSFLYIVINDESHSCLKITDVKDFFTASESDVVHFAEAEMSDFYEGTLTINGKEVIVLKLPAILEKVGKEIASA